MAARALLVALTSVEALFMSAVGWAGSCDEPALARDAFTEAYCRMYQDGWHTPTFLELGTFLGPSLLLTAGGLVASGVRWLFRDDNLAISVWALTAACAITWACLGWLPVVLNVYSRGEAAALARSHRDRPTCASARNAAASRTNG